MMRPISMEIACFRGWKQQDTFSLEKPITAILGENGRGKSSILNAFEWCLFGNEVARKGCGIAERVDWEIRPRGVSGGPTVVQLAVRTDEGRVDIKRCRKANAKVRDGDQLTVRRADGTELSGAAAQLWIQESGFPDWETYRRAHCFHQEAARQRVLDTYDRSEILAALLGLDHDRKVCEMLDSQAPGKLIKDIEGVVAQLNSYCEHAVDQPQRDLGEAAHQLETLGIARHELGDAKAWEVRRNLLNRAAELARNLGFNAEFPSQEDAAAIAQWAPAWSGQVLASKSVLDGLDHLREQVRTLKTAVGDYRSYHESWSGAKKAMTDAIAAGGDAAARAGVLEQAADAHQKAQSRFRQADERVALLHEALKVIMPASNVNRCPVCESEVDDLPRRIEKAIEEARSVELSSLQQAVDASKSTCTAAKDAVDALGSLEVAEERTRGPREKALEELKKLIGTYGTTEVHDVVAKANKTIEELNSSIEHLQETWRLRDIELTQHSRDLELLRKLENWCDANLRANRRVDVANLPAWANWNAAVDAAAGFAADLCALAQAAREAQEKRSNERTESVNSRLEKYYRAIMGESATTGVQVKTHRMPKRLEYNLVDATGEAAVPILNQAAVNALSLALLFAQAEDQAGKGGFACVVLDDPVQSLDEDRQAGLVNAIEEISKSCAVLLAAVPGRITDRLENYVSTERCIVTLEPWSADHGAKVADRREL